MADGLPLDRSTVARSNLVALQRLFPDVTRIVHSASHVAVYAYEASAGWQRRDVEGALFVAKSGTSPTLRAVVMNRKAPAPYVLDLVRTCEFQSRAPYLMVRDPTRPDIGVIGLWFPNEPEQQATLEVLQLATNAARTGRDAFPDTEATEAPGNPFVSHTQTTASTAPAHPATAPAPPAAARTDAPAYPPAQSAPGAAPALKPKVAALFASQGVSQAVPGAAPEPSRAHTAAAAVARPVMSAVSAGLGDVSILLSKRQLAAVLTDMLNDDEFISMLHKKYLEQVTRQASA